jgi:hypothetical protein
VADVPSGPSLDSTPPPPTMQIKKKSYIILALRRCLISISLWSSAIRRGFTLVVERCDDKVVQSASHGPLGELSFSAVRWLRRRYAIERTLTEQLVKYIYIRLLIVTDLRIISWSIYPMQESLSHIISRF